MPHILEVQDTLVLTTARWRSPTGGAWKQIREPNLDRVVFEPTQEFRGLIAQLAQVHTYRANETDYQRATAIDELLASARPDLQQSAQELAAPR